jgi:hypothetical protein
MADIDVAAIALGSPPTQAPVTAYRPAVTVKNNGIAPVSAAGWLSVYDRDTGLLVKTFQVSASSIAPGQTKQASSGEYWTPTEAMIGKHFLWTGNVTCPDDQVPGNNTLAPVDIMVTGGAPPGPQPVEDHAGQHENGGGDELNVDGLPGVLVEAQKPTTHAGDHEVNGTDELDLTGMTGQLATAQVPLAHGSTHEAGGADQITGVVAAPHASSHEPGGADEIEGIGAEPHKTTHEFEGDDQISVEGLSGLLADAQAPVSHKATHQEGGDDQLSVQGLLGQLSEAQAPIAHRTDHQLGGTDPMVGLFYNHDVLHLPLSSNVSVNLPGYTLIVQIEHQFPAPLKKALIFAAVQITLPPSQPAAANARVRLRVNGDLDNYGCQVSQQSNESYVISQAVVFDYRKLDTAAQLWAIDVLCELVDAPYSAELNALHVIPLE